MPDSNFDQSQLLAVLTDIVEGRIAAIEGARAVLQFQALAEDCEAELDVFRGVDSETDHLPVGPIRGKWTAEALRRKDLELTEANAAYQSHVVAAAQALRSKLNGETAVTHPIPRSYPGRPVQRWVRPLPPLCVAREDFVFFVAKNPAWYPMLAVYDWIVACGGAELFGSQIMGGGLVLSTRGEVAHDEGVVLVEFDPKANAFTLFYRNEGIEQEHVETCRAEDLYETLRRLISYKLGLRLELPKPPR